MSDYFKAVLNMDELGMMVYFRRFKPVHETPCFVYCVDVSVNGWILNPLIIGNETGIKLLRNLKERNVRIYRVHKLNSRIAFPTKKKAYDHLVMLKQRQVRHLRRDLNLITHFIKCVENGNECKLTKDGNFIIEDTQDIVHEYYNFDC